MTSSSELLEPLTPLVEFLERLPAIDLPAGRKSIGSEWLEGRLPRPVEDPQNWETRDEEDDEA